MAKFVVLGVAGEDGYWLADLEAGTISALPSTTTDPFGYTAAARSNGASMIAGIDLAVVVDNKDDAFSGRLDGIFSGRLDG